jgi:hypothetical protein
MSTSLLKQIADLERRSLAELQDRWRQLCGTEPPRYNREFMVRRLAYRLQELAHGGLRHETRDQMNQLLEDAGYNELGGLTAGAGPQAHRDQPMPGTRLIREWDGRRYEVTAVDGGFEFEGRRYRSLSAIAKAITGTHWNGRAFFGLPRRGTRRKASR